MHIRNHKGFTLIEIVVVLLIICIIGAAVTISSFYSTSDYNLVSQTEMIKSHLRYAQARAMNTNVPWGIHFNGNNTYKLFKYDASLTYVSVPGESSDTVTLEDMALSPNGATVYVSFDSLGKPYTNALATGSPVANNINITVRYNESELETIVITRNTGFIP
jgi:MSHA pilin protein MshC